MKRVYILPSIKVRAIDTENIMAAISGHDEYTEDPQLGKENDWANEEENHGKVNSYSVWDEE